MRVDGDSRTEQKTWQVYSFGRKKKKKVYGLHLSESRDGFCQRGRGRSFHIDYGPKTRKAREPTVKSVVRGIWRLRVSEAQRRVHEGV